MQMYLWTGNWRFKVMDRKEVERQAVAIRLTALDQGKNGRHALGDLGSSQDATTVQDLENGENRLPSPPLRLGQHHSASVSTSSRRTL